MKKIFLCFFLLLNSYASRSCDMCNCYLGINPQYKKNTIGLRGTQSFYSGTHLSDATLEKYNLTKADFKEIRSNYELQAKFYPIQKLQVQAFVPYVVNSESMSDRAFHALNAAVSNAGNRLAHTDHPVESAEPSMEQSSTIYGIGDPILLMQYQVFNFGGRDPAGFQQRLFAGCGIKLPLGKSTMLDPEEPLEKSHQPGSGSWDFMPSLSYLALYKHWGMNLNANYLVCGSDKYEFQLANHLNINLNLYHEFSRKSLKFYPSLGLYWEQAGASRYGNLIVNQTGGKLLLGHAGIDFYYRKFSFNTALQVPALQDMNGEQPNLKCRFIYGISYSIN